MYIAIIIIILLSLWVVVLLIKSKSKTREIELEKERTRYYRLNVSNKEDVIKQLTLNFKEIDKRIGKLIQMYIHLLTANKVLYVNSSFHPNYSFYKGKFYVKINKKASNNKAVAIPFIKDTTSNNKVLDIIRLANRIKNDKGDLFKDLLQTRNLERLMELHEECTTHKEDVIVELGNKMLKEYK